MQSKFRSNKVLETTFSIDSTASKLLIALVSKLGGFHYVYANYFAFGPTPSESV